MTNPMTTSAITTPHDAFLDAIVSAPDDVAPRLIFADWLDEHSGTVPCGRCDGVGTHKEPNVARERAEFIRVQCRLAAVEAEKIERFNENTDWSQCSEIAASWCPNCGDCICPTDEHGNHITMDGQEYGMDNPACQLHGAKSLHCCLDDIEHRLKSLRRRERELLTAEHARIWGPSGMLWDAGLKSPTCTMPGNDELVVQGYVGLEYRRGFVEVVHCLAADWLAHGPAIVRAAPLTQVRLTDREPAGFVFEGRQVYAWDCWGCLGDYAWYVDEQVFKHLKGTVLHDNKQVSYNTPELAHADLSRACLLWARERAGLPTLSITLPPQ